MAKFEKTFSRDSIGLTFVEGTGTYVQLSFGNKYMHPYDARVMQENRYINLFKDEAIEMAKFILEEFDA